LLCRSPLSLVVNIGMVLGVYLSIIRESSTRTLHSNASFPSDFVNANFRTLRCSDNRTYFERDELAERIYRFTYQFPVEFALLSLCYLIPMWNWQQHTSPNTGKREEYVCILASNADMNVHVRYIISERSSLIPAFRRHRLMNLLKLCYQTALRCLSRHAVYPSVIFAACKFSSSALFDKLQDGGIVTDDNPQRSDTESVQIIIQTVITYVLCTVALVGFVLIRSERASKLQGQGMDDIFLLLGAVEIKIVFNSNLYNNYLL